MKPVVMSELAKKIREILDQDWKIDRLDVGPPPGMRPALCTRSPTQAFSAITLDQYFRGLRIPGYSKSH